MHEIGLTYTEILSILVLFGTLISIYVNLRQRITKIETYTSLKILEIEKSFDDHKCDSERKEKEVSEKLDLLITTITEIKVDIAKLKK